MPGILDGLSEDELLDLLKVVPGGVLGINARQRAKLDDPVIQKYGKAIRNLVTSPERAIRAAGELQRTGEYDPEPAMTALQLGPMASAPGAALAAREAGTMLPALYFRNTGSRFGRELIDETGKSRGNISVYQRGPEGKEVRVGGLYGEHTPDRVRDISDYAQRQNPLSHTMTREEIKSLFMALRHEFPEAETISGFRVSGIRRAAGGGEAKKRMPHFTQEQMDEYWSKAPAELRAPPYQSPPPPAVGPHQLEAQRLAQGTELPPGSRMAPMEPLGQIPMDPIRARVAEPIPAGRHPDATREMTDEDLDAALRALLRDTMNRRR